jgi:hypothetical protein
LDYVGGGKRERGNWAERRKRREEKESERGK